MLEPFTALSLAGNILQFIDFGQELVSGTLEVYQSLNGASDSNTELHDITKDLSEFLTGLQLTGTGQHSLSSDERQLYNTAQICSKIANELMQALQELQSRNPAHFRTLYSIRLALKRIWEKKKIDEVKRRMDDAQKVVHARLVNMLSNKQSVVLRKLDSITKGQIEMGINSERKLSDLQLDIIDAIHQQRKKQDAINQILLNKLSTLTVECRNSLAEQDILGTLSFPELRQRYDTVRKAYSKTFDWIFDDGISCSSASTKFPIWLEGQNGMYWISGKAGSGKSTLMKFLCEDERTKNGLATWVGPDASLVMATFFFWAGGSLKQKSLGGLLQSLLYQTLRQCPEFIPKVLPQRWAQSASDDVGNLTWSSWSEEELLMALDLLCATSREQSSIKFCFFIDGLDEYKDFRLNLLSTLRSLASSTNIKVCVSSRPYTVFKDTFGRSENGAMLQLEQHTKNDIQRYVKENLETDNAFQEVEKNDPRYAHLIRDVADKANGVFLWVYLVVRSIRGGLSDKNKFEILRGRLDKMPPSLEEYFQAIFDSIDPYYQRLSAQVLLSSVHAVQPLSFYAYHHLLNMTSRTPTSPLTSSDIKNMSTEVRTNLHALCGDLLELNSRNLESVFSYRVDFLHATVREFLSNEEMHESLEKRAKYSSGADFNYWKSLCELIFAQIQVLNLNEGIEPCRDDLFPLVDELMFYAREAEEKTGVPDVKFLDEVDCFLQNRAIDMDIHWTNARDRPTGKYNWEHGQSNFLALTIQFGLHHLVEDDLGRNPGAMQSKEGRPLLDYCLRPRIVTPVELPRLTRPINLKLLRVLLRHNANPNQRVEIYDDRTVWNLFLYYCHEERFKVDDETKRNWYEVCNLLLTSGADPGVKIKTRRKALPHRYEFVDERDQWDRLSVSYILQKVLRPSDFSKINAQIVDIYRSQGYGLWIYNKFRDLIDLGG